MRLRERLARQPKWRHLVLGLAVVAAVMMVTPALGGPSLKSLVKKEVAKQIAKASGPAGANGTNGADGTARAFGRVAGNGTLTRSKNATVTHPATGFYCIALAGGIDASQTGLTATPDFSGDSTGFGPGGGQTIVEWESGAVECPAGTLEVLTGFRTITTVGSPDGDVRQWSLQHLDQAFFFVVP